jgi:hypothetical protein
MPSATVTTSADGNAVKCQTVAGPGCKVIQNGHMLLVRIPTSSRTALAALAGMLHKDPLQEGRGGNHLSDISLQDIAKTIKSSLVGPIEACVAESTQIWEAKPAKARARHQFEYRRSESLGMSPAADTKLATSATDRGQEQRRGTGQKPTGRRPPGCKSLARVGEGLADDADGLVESQARRPGRRRSPRRETWSPPRR